MISVKLCLHVTPLCIVCAATVVCGLRSGRGPGQTAPVWPLRLWMCRLLSGQGPLLCLGWSHLLQILPCWDLHQEVTTHTHTRSQRQVPFFSLQVRDISTWHQSVHFCSIGASCAECHDALRLVYYHVGITGSGRHGGPTLCNTYQYALNTLSTSMLYCSLSSHPSLALSSHVGNVSLTLCSPLAPISADDSGGRMFAMATPSSCAMDCKLMVSVQNDSVCMCVPGYACVYLLVMPNK